MFNVNRGGLLIYVSKCDSLYLQRVRDLFAASGYCPNASRKLADQWDLEYYGRRRPTAKLVGLVCGTGGG